MQVNELIQQHVAPNQKWLRPFFYLFCYMLCKFSSVRFLALLFGLFSLMNLHAQDGAVMTETQPPDSTILLDSITVQGFRLSTHERTFPGSISVLTSNAIRSGDGTNMATALNTVPGLSMQSGTFATNRIVIRGMGSRTPYNTNRIRTYLNDLPLTTADGVSAPEEIDLYSLGRIEVIKGPASALYGSGLGGSIQLFTPVKWDNGGNFSLNYGSFNTLKANLSGSLNTESTNLWASLSRLQSDGYRENNAYNRTTLLSTAQWKKTKWSVRSTILLTDLKGEIPSSLGITQFENNPQAAASNWLAIGGFKKSQKILTGITLVNILSSRLSNQLTLHGKWSNSFEKRPFNNLADQNRSAGLRNKLGYYRQKTDWILGIDWIAEQYGWKLDKDEKLLNENMESRNQLSIFGIVNYRPVSRFHISVAATMNSIRFQLTDRYAANGNQSAERIFPLMASPRIGLTYEFNEKFVAYASVGHGFSMPSPEETLLPEGDVNPYIKPEQGIQYEVGSRFSFFNQAFEVDAGLYWIELIDLLLTKRISEDIFTGMNAGRTRHQGLEILLRNSFFSYNRFPGSLYSSFTYTLMHNRFIDFTDDGNSRDGNTLPGIPEQTLQFQLAWNPIGSLELSTTLYYSGDQYLNDANSLKYGDYSLINLKASMQIPLKKSGGFSFYAGINNLTNSHYASMLVVNAIGFGNNEARYYYPGLPRNMYAGIEIKF